MAGITGKDAILTDYANSLTKLDAPKGRSLGQDALRRLRRISSNGAIRRSIGPASASRPTLPRAIISGPTRMGATCLRACCKARR